MNPVLKLNAIVQSMREALWFWPGITVIVAVSVGLTLAGPLAVVGNLDFFFVFKGNLAAGLQVLSALLGAVITAVSVVFSATLIVLQTISSQFSPRLLRNLIRDPAIQTALSVFLGTVAFILAILHGADSSDSANVPRLAISIALLLVLVCVAMIGYFVHHLSNAIRVESIMEQVTRDTMTAIDRTGNRYKDTERVSAPLPDVPAYALEVAATSSGYLQNVALPDLGEFASESGLIIRLRHGIGERVIEAAPVAWVWSRTGELSLPEPDMLERQVNSALELGYQRLLQFDPAFGFRQLVDMGIKALSPGINDPYTAVQAVDYLTRLLCRLAPRLPVTLRWAADDEPLCVAGPGARFDIYLALAFDQICRYGAKEPAVALSLLNAVRDVSAVAPRRHDAALHQVVDRILAAASHAIAVESDVERVRAAVYLTRRWIDGDHTPEPQAEAAL